MEKILPRGISYSDIKPEAIESMVKVVRFTPTATVNNAKANDIIRFQLQGAGFYDPYSAYIKIEVQCDLANFQPTPANPFCGRFLDRSAHSLIGRLVIKSQGTELERIEQYDILAAMLNDMLYSQEQAIVHHFEGMGCKTFDSTTTVVTNAKNGLLLQAVPANNADDINAGAHIATLYFNQLNQDTQGRYLGEPGFWKSYFGTLNPLSGISAQVAGGAPNPHSYFASSFYQTGVEPAMAAAIEPFGFLYTPASNILGNVNSQVPAGTNASSFLTFQEYMMMHGTWNAAGVRQPTFISSPNTLTFCIPIYSGILGVLMTDKKMLPLSLMPLEVEFTVNPYAFYDVGNPAVVTSPRDFTISKFWIYSHMLFFEQELHRSLESVVAENGIFIHFNSFYLAPITTHVNNTVTQYAQINIHAKSINSVHFVFIYTGFEPTAGVRKLNFSNHNLSYLQIRNGTELTPNEPIQGDQFNGKQNHQHIQFLLETYKAYNKMHDPTTDAALSPFNFSVDRLLIRPVNELDVLMQQSQLGRCQYGISLEGEELGQDKQIISGRKGLIPFDINMQGSQKTNNVTSFQFIFVRADYLIFVRPDLVVTLLGR